MKKIISICLIFCLMLGMTSIASAEGVNVDGTNEAVNVDAQLLERGYPQIILDTMDDASKTRVLSSGGTYAGGSILYYNDEERQFTEIVVNTDGSYVMPRGQISTSDLTLSIVYSRIREAVGRLAYIQVTFNYNWIHLPTERYEDPLTIAWDEELFDLCGGTFVKEDKYDGFIINADGSLLWYYDQTHSYEEGYANGGDAGVTWYADLRGFSGFHVTGLHGYGDFKIQPEEPTFAGSANLYGHYVHAKGSGTIGITIGPLSVSVNSVDPYDERGIMQSITW